MSSSLAPVWFNFFLEAGIPPSDAGNYAVTFTQNRIQPDMMTDLTKEYLAEMGITVLGDVIAILKHARFVHTQATREKALQYTGLAQQLPELPEADGSPATTQAANKNLQKSLTKKTPATVSVQKAVAKTITPVSVTVPVSVTKTVSEKTSTGLEKSLLSVRKTKNQPAKPAAGVKLLSVKKPSQLTKTQTLSNGATIQLRMPADAKVQQSISLQQESRSQVSASTDRVGKARMLPEEPPLVRPEFIGGKSSVFNRLGREVSSSSDTAVTKTASDKTVFKVTLQGIDDSGLVQSKSNQAKNASIFDRLGNKTSVEPLDSVSTTLPTRKVGTGESKVTVSTTTKRPLVKKTTSGKSLKDRLGPLATAAAAAATASTKSEGIFSHEVDHSTNTASAKLRLGIKRPMSTTVAMELPSPPKQAKTDIKTRLGLPNTNVVATSASRPVAVAKPQLQEQSARPKISGVFGRLGSSK